MKRMKKLNLLPQQVKDGYINRYFKMSLGAVCLILALVVTTQYARIGILNIQINHIENENKRYDTEEKNIAKLQSEIDNYQLYISSYEGNRYFPFSRFMNDLETNRPDTVTIISVDTDDRLVNEGAREEKDTSEKADKDKKAENNKTEEEQKEADIVVPEIKYESDIAGKTITIRGYGKESDDITKFIYKISNFPYVRDVAITGIEEHKMLEKKTNNIFEIKLTGGTAK